MDAGDFFCLFTVRSPGNILSFLSVILISDCGCSGLEKSIYDAETVSSLDSVSVTSVRILNDSFLWRFPLQIECANPFIVML